MLVAVAEWSKASVSGYTAARDPGMIPRPDLFVFFLLFRTNKKNYSSGFPTNNNNHIFLTVLYVNNYSYIYYS